MRAAALRRRQALALRKAQQQIPEPSDVASASSAATGARGDAVTPPCLESSGAQVHRNDATGVQVGPGDSHKPQVEGEGTHNAVHEAVADGVGMADESAELNGIGLGLFEGLNDARAGHRVSWDDGGDSDSVDLDDELKLIFARVA